MCCSPAMPSASRSIAKPDLSVTTRLSAAGEITYPMLGQIKLAGLSAYAAQELIAKKLDVDLIVNPQVALSIVEYTEEYFTVLGEVSQPRASMSCRRSIALTLLEAIGTAGGYTPYANFSAVEDNAHRRRETAHFQGEYQGHRQFKDRRSVRHPAR